MLKHRTDYNDCLPYERSGGRPTEKKFKNLPHWKTGEQLTPKP